MKRIANDVAVESVLYTMKGNARVKIVDYNNLFDLNKKENGKVIFDGKVSDSYSYATARATRSKIYETSIEIEDGAPIIVFSVKTCNEQF